MPAHPCMRTTAGNGPAPSGRSSHAGTASGFPGVAFGKDRLGMAHPVMTIEARSTDSVRRSMNRAYTAPQRAAKRERLLPSALIRAAPTTDRFGSSCRADAPWIVRDDRIRAYLASQPTEKLNAKLVESFIVVPPPTDDPDSPGRAAIRPGAGHVGYRKRASSPEARRPLSSNHGGTALGPCARALVSPDRSRGRSLARLTPRLSEDAPPSMLAP